MALEQGDNTEARSFLPSGLTDRAGLCRSAQDLFQPIDRAIANRQDLPWALDFGTGADLYRLPAYTGERLSASALMTDDVEQKLEAPKIQSPSDATAEAGVISGQGNQNQHEKAFKLAHAADRTPSGIMPALHESFGIEGVLTAADRGSKPIKTQTAPDAVVAWDPRKDAQTKLDQVLYPHRDNRDAFVDKDAARYVSQNLSRLAAYSERHDGIGPKLIAAILKNEQTYYRTDKDALPDAIVRRTGDLPKDLTIGPAQMSISNIRQLAKEYPDVLGSVADSTHLATDKTYATMLVGAYLDNKIQVFENWTKHPPDLSKLSKDERYQYDHALPLWKAGMETKALIMSYNPAAGLDHMNNVLKYLRD